MDDVAKLCFCRKLLQVVKSCQIFCLVQFYGGKKRKICVPALVTMAVTPYSKFLKYPLRTGSKSLRLWTTYNISEVLCSSAVRQNRKHGQKPNFFINWSSFNAMTGFSSSRILDVYPSHTGSNEKITTYLCSKGICWPKACLSLGPLTPNFHLRLEGTNKKKIIIIITSAFQHQAGFPCQCSFPEVTLQVSLNSHKTCLLKSQAFFIESIYCNRFYTIYILQNCLHFKII